VGARRTKKLPKQVLPFDQNEGAGFWWANCRNTFTRNVAADNDLYGYRFEATRGSNFDPTLRIRQPDGTQKPVDIRTLPFVRFDDNESHCDGLYGFNLGEGVDRVGPDARHPFVIRRMKIWESHYAFRVQSPSVQPRRRGRLPARHRAQQAQFVFPVEGRPALRSVRGLVQEIVHSARGARGQAFQPARTPVRAPA